MINLIRILNVIKFIKTIKRKVIFDKKIIQVTYIYFLFLIIFDFKKLIWDPQD